MGEGALSTFITSITGALSDLNITNIGLVIVAALGVAIPLVLGWFAYRFIYGKVKGTFLGG